MRIAVSAGLAGALTLVGIRAARAAPAPCAPDQSRIEVTVDGADLLAPAIFEELEAELARAHLCTSAPGDRSLRRERPRRRDVPTRVGDGDGWTVISLDTFHACGVRRGGSLYCWGRNIEGQLGLGDIESRTTFTPVVLPPG